ncbi:DNA-directed RNA polymerase I chain-like protein (nucleomorph) [Lotharella oceanica]|uniref:DNA-directed RNA polymerase n=2 Tax=Lotharella oceanica TaxID=641309 RepID=A0A060DGT1_9EUKA|nr:DNA-directed RNA polymerase I chain-like protein [Lotharella oceanica]
MFCSSHNKYSKSFFENINFKHIYKSENKNHDKYNFCTKCKKNALLQNIDDKFFISYYILSKKQKDKITPNSNVNEDLKNILKRVRVIILNFTEIRENLRKIWHSDSFFLEHCFKKIYLLREFCKTYWSSFVDYNNFFIKSINGKYFFSNFYNARIVKSKTIESYHFNLVKKKMNNIKKNLEYNIRLKKNENSINVINLDYKSFVQRIQQKIYIFKKNNRIKSLNRIMEKKRGLVRNNIFGKRVNYSSRSVVTPDPFIKGGCVGFSGIIAKKIHLIDYFTLWNIVYFKKRNQDFTYIFKKKYFELYMVNKITKFNLINFFKILKKTSEYNLFVPVNNNTVKTIVIGKPFLRTIHDNDYMVVNRQPTLHKLGIMGHRSKILPSCLVFSINYVNCKSYNADFDGDEINIHIMQSIQSKTEILNILSSDLHTTIPRDGSIIRNFIQDSLVSLMLMTKKDNFIEEEELEGIVKDDMLLKYVLNSPPTIYIKYCKRKLWSGKQLFTYILQYYILGNCKINHFYLKDSNCKNLDFKILKFEEKITFLFEGNLIIGTINKDDFKNKGIFLKIHEHLGNVKFTDFIRKLDRVCLFYIMRRGLTLGSNEIKLCDRYKFRINYNSAYIEKLFKRISGRICEFVSFFISTFVVSIFFKFKTLFDDQLDNNIDGFKDFFRKKIWDFNMLDRFNKKDSYNSFVHIIESGSKGSYRNMDLICFKMGYLNVGKNIEDVFYFFRKTTESLFYFTSYFLGLNFLEFYIHSISGRIGLLESSLTVYKSGYLQRTMIKNIENMYIAEDFTFRDASNNEIITFTLGTENTNYNHFYYKKYYYFMNNHFIEKVLKLFKIMLYKKTSPINFIFQSIHKQRSLLFTNLDNNYSRFIIKNIFTRKIKPRLIDLRILLKTLEFLDIGKVFLDVSCFNNVLFKNYIYSIVQLAYQSISSFKKIHFNEYVGILCGQSLCQPLTQMTLDSFHNIGLLDHSEIDGISKLCYIIQEMIQTKHKPIISFTLNDKSRKYLPVANTITNSINPLVCSNILEDVYYLNMINKNTYSIYTYIIDMVKTKMFRNSLKFNFKLLYLKFKNLILLDFLKFYIFKFNLKKLNNFEKINIKNKKKFKKISNYKKFTNFCTNINRIMGFSIYGNNFYLSFGVEKLKYCMRYVYKVFRKNLKITYHFVKKTIREHSFIDYTNNTMQICIILKRFKIIYTYNYSFIKFTHIINIQNSNKINYTYTNYLLGGSFANIISQGINIAVILKYKKFLKTSSIYLGDHYNFFYFFGIEATYSKIYKEMVCVLKMMKISVNHFYLKLIANFMTFKGCVIKLNRSGMSISGSFVHKMGYEDIYKYFKEGIEHFFIEKLYSHSASLLLGEQIKNGSGNNRILL